MIITINQRLKQLWSNSNCLCLARNLSLRFTVKTLGNSKPNWSWQNSTESIIFVLKFYTAFSFYVNLIIFRGAIREEEVCYLSVSVCLSVCVCVCVCLQRFPICPSFCLFLCLSVWLFVSVAVCLSGWYTDVQGDQYSAAHRFSRRATEFTVCHGICYLPWKMWNCPFCFFCHTDI